MCFPLPHFFSFKLTCQFPGEIEGLHALFEVDRMVFVHFYNHYERGLPIVQHRLERLAHQVVGRQYNRR